MARESYDLTLNDNGKERHFKVKEMPALTGFLFGVKAVKFLCNNSANVSASDDIASMIVKSIGGLNFDDFQAVMNEALSYVDYMDGVSPRPCNGDTLNTILTDPVNVMKVVYRALEVNLSFIKRAMPADFQEKISGAMTQAGLTAQTSTKD